MARRLYNGRFKTREELTNYVRQQYAKVPGLTQKDLAEDCLVSQTIIRTVLRKENTF
jgi:predicted transcriptional regulator